MKFEGTLKEVMEALDPQRETIVLAEVVPGGRPDEVFYGTAGEYAGNEDMRKFDEVRVMGSEDVENPPKAAVEPGKVHTLVFLWPHDYELT